MRAILLEASDLPEEERESYLAQACGDDDELRRKAKAILAVGSEPSAVLRRAADLPETTVAPLTAKPPIPNRIAGYRIIRIIGQGGMGIVYEAEQEKPKRIVALKVMRSGIASKSALRRFEYESQLLARLTHPGIGQVYEAGTYDDGTMTVPYFAMEYVPDAKSIIEYAEEKKLGTRERLQLFAQVCDAVHHGHQKGIIHRDLKPGNILVNPEGQVKIIDFGVARSTDSDMVLTTLQTDVGQLIGTLQYMSPEQCQADPNDIDTRSDVYALGVVQYELLCGRLPYDVRKKAFHEVTRLIREEPPTRPSSISKQLRGDVETITLKALEKKRDRRYQSAVELGQDIQRYLSGEAIIGRPPSILYQLQIFARRHKVVFAALATILVVLAAGMAVSTGMYFRAEQAREETAQERDRALAAEQEAEKRRAEAEAVTTFLSDTLAAVDPSEAQGKEVTVREMLDKASEKIKETFGNQPLVGAALRATIGNTYHSLGAYSTAEKHLMSALEARKRELGEEHPDTLASMDDLAMLFMDQTRFKEAEILQVEVLGSRRKVLGEVHLDTITSMRNLGEIYWYQFRFDEAESLLVRALELRKRLLGNSHPDTLKTKSLLALTLNSLTRYAEAEPLYTETLEQQRQVLGNEHPDTLFTMINLTVCIGAQDRFAEAEQRSNQAIEITRRVLGEEHPFTLAARSFRAYLYGRQGRKADAEQLYLQVLEAQRELLGEEDGYTRTTSRNLAYFYVNQGKYDKAESLLVRLIESCRQVLGEGHLRTLRVMWDLAYTYSSHGRHDDAVNLYEETLEICRRIHGEEHPDTLNTMHGLAMVYGQTDRYEKAVALSEKVLEYRRSALGEEHPKTCSARQILAWWYGQWGRHEMAASLHKKNFELRLRVLGEEHNSTLTTMNNLAFHYCELGRLEEAEPLYKQALEIHQRVLGEDHESTIIPADNLASKIYRDQGRFDEALPLFKKTLETARKSLPDGHKDTGIILSNYGSCLTLMGRYGEAESMLLEAHEILTGTLGPNNKRTIEAVDHLISLNTAWGEEEKAAKWEEERKQ